MPMLLAKIKTLVVLDLISSWKFHGMQFMLLHRIDNAHGPLACLRSPEPLKPGVPAEYAAGVYGRLGVGGYRTKKDDI
jgi:hypothetical protein